MKKKAVIVDLDGTLSDSFHRHEHALKKEWKQFFDKMTEDQPKLYVAIMMKTLREAYNHKVIFVTGRMEQYRTRTVDWMLKHGLRGDLMYMRQDDDYRDDSTVKVEIYRHHIEPHFDVKLVLEDRDRVVKAWREIGLECWQVQDGNY